MKRANRALSDTERRAASERIWAQVAASAEFAAARCVALFCSLADEPDTAAVLASWSRLKRIVVPRVEGETMQFYDYDPATMVCGAFGIAEPGPGRGGAGPGRSICWWCRAWLSPGRACGWGAAGDITTVTSRSPGCVRAGSGCVMLTSWLRICRPSPTMRRWTGWSTTRIPSARCVHGEAENNCRPFRSAGDAPVQKYGSPEWRPYGEGRMTNTS